MDIKVFKTLVKEKKEFVSDGPVINGVINLSIQGGDLKK